MSKMDEKEAGAIVLGIIFALALAIIISRQLFPIFLGLSIVTLIGLIIVVVFELFNDSFGEISLYVGGAFVVLFLLTSITWFIGYGIGGTSFGEASVEIYTTITGAEQQVSQELQNAINQVIDESCKTLDEQNCNLLKTTAKSAQTLQEVTDKANQLKSIADTAKSIS
jgi:ABC-type multidrug transport system fused ATPase/permease subunit